MTRVIREKWANMDDASRTLIKWGGMATAILAIAAATAWGRDQLTSKVTARVDAQEQAIAQLRRDQRESSALEAAHYVSVMNRLDDMVLIFGTDDGTPERHRMVRRVAAKNANP